MIKDVIIGVDAGTSMTKAVAFDLDGRQIESASLHNNYTLRPDGGAEQSMAQTWEDCVSVLRALAEKVPDLPTRSAALSITAQGDGTWLVDRQNKPVMNAWLWLDSRAAVTADAIRARAEDQKRFEITGTGISACQMGAQLGFMRDHHADALAEADCAMHCKDWIYLNLTGMRATDPSEGTFTFGDYKTRTYSDDVIEILGLTGHRSLLPEMLDGTTTSHPLSDEAAQLTGLSAGMPVVLGYVDVVCTALGAGAYRKGSSAGCTIVGSTGVHIKTEHAMELTLNNQRTGYLMAMPIPEIFAQLQSNMASTLNIDWLLGVARDLLTTFDKEVSHSELVARLDGWLEEAQPGGILYHPYISDAGERGPFIDARARASFNGLSANHRFPDLVRGVVDGLALAARDCYSAMGSLPQEVCLTGGAARSKELRQTIANALGANISLSERDEAGAAGAAMIASVCIGNHSDMDACIAQWVDPFLGAGASPDAHALPLYDHLFDAYQSARQCAGDVWAKMETVRGHVHA